MMWFYEEVQGYTVSVGYGNALLFYVQ